MMNVTSKDGTKIAYEKSGHGPALILVDGATAYRAFGSMLPLAEHLKSDFTVYAYDRRGRGESGDTLPFAVEREIEDIEVLVDTAGGKAYLFGISSGGILALKASAALGSKVKGLAVYEPPLVLGEAARNNFETYAKNLRGHLKAGNNDEAAMDFIRYVATVTPMGSPEQMEGMRQAPFWPGMMAVAPTLDYDATIIGGEGVPAEAAKLTVPVLVMAGGASPESLRDAAAKALAEAIPGATSKVLPEQTHDVAPAVLAPELIAFFKR